MGKIAIGRTLGETLGFVFGRYFSLFGAAWLPLLILGIAYYLSFAPFFAAIVHAAAESAAHPGVQPSLPELQASMRWMPLLQLVALVVTAWLNVAITKAALGIPRRFPFAYLEFGRDEARLIGANLVVFAFIYAGIIAIALIALVVGLTGAALYSGGALNGVGALPHGPLLGLIVTACITAVILVALYPLIRLTFLLAPATVIEKRFALWRSWELSRGNFWRMLAIVVVVALILLAIEIAVVAASVFVFVVLIAGHAGPHHGAETLTSLSSAMPVLAIPLIFLMPLLFGLQLAPSAFAYRSLVPPPKPTSPTTPVASGS